MGKVLQRMKTHLGIFVLILLALPPAVTASQDGKSRNWTGTVRGEVMKIDGETFLIEDSLGRKVRLLPGPNCSRDENIQVGDEIVARVVHKGKETYIKSLKRLSLSTAPNGSSPLIEGEVLNIIGDSYVVQDITGREVRLHVDTHTWREGNITVGDSILANIDNLQTAHAESLTKQ
jgi:uncharacterized protein YdeI (BOF family)